MRMSTDEAISLFDKYIAQRTLLRLTYGSASGVVDVRFTGFLRIEDSSNLAVVSTDGDAVMFSISGCSFEYGDMREAEGFMREDVAVKFGSIVTILFPDSPERVYLLEVARGH